MTHSREPEVDAEQLAALRRLRAAFGDVQVIEVLADEHPADDEPERTQGQLEKADARPGQDDLGGAGTGSRAAPPGGDDAGASGSQ